MIEDFCRDMKITMTRGWGTLACFIVFMAILFATGVLKNDAAAAIHADKPVQETVPAASKDKPTCVQSTTIERFIVRDGGKWQRLGGPVTVLSECHA